MAFVKAFTASANQVTKGCSLFREETSATILSSVQQTFAVSSLTHTDVYQPATALHFHPARDCLSIVQSV